MLSLEGEGIFFASLVGPGEVWIQKLRFSRLASKVVSSAPQVPDVLEDVVGY